MADDLHHCAFVLELFQLVLFNDFSFDLFDSDHGVFPASAIDDTVATLGQFTFVAKLGEGYLVVLDEGSRLVRDIVVRPVLLLLKQSLFQFPLQVLRVRPGLLHLFKFLLVVR